MFGTRYPLCLWLLCILLPGCRASEKHAGPVSEPGNQLVVFAASSLRDALTDISAVLLREQGLVLSFNFGGSNALAQQIDAAPRADVFLSANAEWVDFLKEKQRLVDGTDHAFLANKLVVVAHRDSDFSASRPEELAALPFKFLFVGDPNGVPAGKYARAALLGITIQGRDLWSQLLPRVVPAQDVRAALSLVESDPRGVGVVYRSDVLASPNLRILFELSEASPKDAVRYYAAVVRSSKDPGRAAKFVQVLQRADIQAVFMKFGFLPISTDAQRPEPNTK